MCLPAPAIPVVIVTRDRRERLLSTLARLAALPERPSVVVVDNGSRDGTVAAVRARHRDVEVLALDRDHGAAARNVGLRSVDAPYVSLCDDDSWWAPGALERAARAMDAAPRVAVLAARVLVGDEERLDPTCELMAASPMPPAAGLPWPRVLGFVACGAVVRREAVLAVGGFDRHYGIGGEENQPRAQPRRRGMVAGLRARRGGPSPSSRRRTSGAVAPGARPETTCGPPGCTARRPRRRGVRRRSSRAPAPRRRWRSSPRCAARRGCSAAADRSLPRSSVSCSWSSARRGGVRPRPGATRPGGARTVAAGRGRARGPARRPASSRSTPAHRAGRRPWGARPC